jgi:hypothetical protein
MVAGDEIGAGKNLRHDARGNIASIAWPAKLARDNLLCVS